MIAPAVMPEQTLHAPTVVRCPLCDNAPAQFDCEALLYPGRSWPVKTCPQCGASFFEPVPTSEDVAHCYPHSYYRDFFKQYWKDYYKGRALAHSIRKWRAKGSFLDVGCALGTLLAGVRESGWTVFGLEYSPWAVEAGAKLHDIPIVQGGLTVAPWPDGSLDYIHANNVLEHETDPAGALAAASRLLNRGGRLHLTLPNGPVDLLPNRKLYRRFKKPVETRHSGHIFFYSAKSLETLLRRVGMKMIRLRNFHFKTALKAHGWTPGAYRQFENSGHGRAPESETLSLDQYKQLIPSPPNWWLYYLKYRLRRLWRLPHVEWGYDFEVIAEK